MDKVEALDKLVYIYNNEGETKALEFFIKLLKGEIPLEGESK